MCFRARLSRWCVTGVSAQGPEPLVPRFSIHVTKESVSAGAGAAPCAPSLTSMQGASLVFDCAVDDGAVQFMDISVSESPLQGDPEDWRDGVYQAECAVLADTLYAAFQDYLAERGIDDEFCASIEQLCDDAEYAQYLHWLQAARNFAQE